MKVCELPVSTCIGEAADAPTLALCLQNSLGKDSYRHFRSTDVILDGKQTGRILCCSSFGYGLPLLRAMSFMEIANELVKLAETSRYPGLPEHRVGWDKGWQLRRADGPRGTCVIAWAAWIPPR